MNDFKIVADYAYKCHDDANCTYGKDESYSVHIDMVVDMVDDYKTIFKRPIDRDITIAGAFCHDILEDTKQSYNNVSQVIGRDAADVVLAVTDVSAENRLMKHLLTMGKTVLNYRAIILKMCDICANATYSKTHGSSMYAKYVEEYQYRRPIFKKALTWYKNELDADMLQQLWDELDNIHGYTELKQI